MPARVRSVGQGGGCEVLSWSPGTAAGPSLERTSTTLAQEQVMRMYLSEYMIANYLLEHVPSALEAAQWNGAASQAVLSLDLGEYEFEWTAHGDGLRFKAIVSKSPKGDLSFRQEFVGHRKNESLGCELASRRQMLIPSEGDQRELEHVNTAILEMMSVVERMPPGFTELDTSTARVVDVGKGIVYDDQGNEIGKIVTPGPAPQGSRWATLAGVLGVGLFVGGGVWWWLQRRGVA